MKRLKIAAMSVFCAAVLGVLAWGGQQPAPSQNAVVDAVKKAAEKPAEKPDPLALDAAAKAEIKKLVNSFDTLGEELAVAQEQVKVLTDLRNKKLQAYREFLVREAGKRGLDPAGYLVDTDAGKLVAIPKPEGKKWRVPRGGMIVGESFCPVSWKSFCPWHVVLGTPKNEAVGSLDTLSRSPAPRRFWNLTL